MLNNLLENTKIKSDFVQFQKHFPSFFTSQEAVMEQINAYSLKASGKMLRPLAWLALRRIFEPNCTTPTHEQLTPISALEMVHMATLLHDDVIDEADTRRGQQTVCKKWNNLLSVLAGDFLSSRAFVLIAPYSKLNKHFARAVNRLTEGEIAQAHYSGSIRLSVEKYHDIIDKKTATLFQLIVRILADQYNWNDKKTTVLLTYMYYFGKIFQLQDDLLDYTSSHKVLGKPILADLKEGKITLPIMLGMEESGALKQHVQKILQHTQPIDEKEILQLFANTQAVKRCEAQIYEWEKLAHNSILTLHKTQQQAINKLLVLASKRKK